MKTAGQRGRRGPEKVQNQYELYENWPRPVRIVMDRFGAGFLNRAVARFTLRSRCAGSKGSAGGECFWFLYAAHGDFATGNSKSGGARSGARADRARWGRAIRKLAGNAPRKVCRFAASIFCRGPSNPSLADSQGKLKPRPTKTGTRIAWRGRLERPVV